MGNNDIKTQQAVAEVQHAFGFIGNELRRDFVEFAARRDDDAGAAETGDLVGDAVPGQATAFGDFLGQERAAVG
jgi:hypothetical protein